MSKTNPFNSMSLVDVFAIFLRTRVVYFLLLNKDDSIYLKGDESEKASVGHFRYWLVTNNNITISFLIDLASGIQE